MNYTVFDAAEPPSAPPVFAQGAMGYLGGPRAARAWTLDEWLPFRGLKQYGIYVPDIGADPQQQGQDAAELAVALGWSDKMAGDEQRAIIIDMETSVDAAWYKSIAAAVGARGFMPVCYGSLDTVLGNAASDVLAAEWINNPAMPAGQTLHGNQYQANVAFLGTIIDKSVIDGWLYKRGGVGPRRAVAQ